MASSSPAHALPQDPKMKTWKDSLLLSFQSLGVVFGHLSIAPLFVFPILTPDDIRSVEWFYELFSFIFWTMTLIALVKYVILVIRADDNGEGGTFAFYSLPCRHAKVGLLPNHQLADDELLSYEMENFPKRKLKSRARRAIEKHKGSRYLMLFLALFGSCMVIANGVLTPAISVFSASRVMEHSLKEIPNIWLSGKHQESVDAHIKKYATVPITCAILAGLFASQRYGTQRIGFIFAPIVVSWLLFNGGIGLYNVLSWNPGVIHALSPGYVYKYIRHLDFGSWKSLGVVLLCIGSIRSYICRSWTFLKKIYPGCLHHVYTVMALLASVVESQAAITGTFSIINQCLALGCFPRVKVVHTSERIRGQVYIPDVNWILMVLSIAITIGFGDIKPLASATDCFCRPCYIITGMLITTCLMSLVMTLYWERNSFISACFLVFFWNH